MNLLKISGISFLKTILLGEISGSHDKGRGNPKLGSRMGMSGGSRKKEIQEMWQRRPESVAEEGEGVEQLLPIEVRRIAFKSRQQRSNNSFTTVLLTPGQATPPLSKSS